MHTSPTPRPPSLGPARLVGAFRYSLAGLRHASHREAAFQQELIALCVLMPAALWLPASGLERLILVLSMLHVLAMELFNSAIEAVVDRVSLERHPLAGQAKDMASAAVLLGLVMSAACWLVVAGPLLGRWLLAAVQGAAS